ncbi:MAG: NYN domain-containing protein [Candidatus Paceibacterota bacterium]
MTATLERPPRITRAAPTPCIRPLRAALRQVVYFFLDFSNIAISASQLAPDYGDGVFGQRSVRLHSENLRSFVQRERIWGSGYAAAGLTDQRSLIKRPFEQVDITFDICERGCITGAEQNVDQRIQLEMMRLLEPDVEKGTVVLATGDGNGFSDNQGFIRTLAALHRSGFGVEVMSWRHSFNQHLRDWTHDHGGRVIELDDFYHDLTFIKDGRRATPKHQLGNKLARCLAA